MGNAMSNAMSNAISNARAGYAGKVVKRGTWGDFVVGNLEIFVPSEGFPDSTIDFEPCLIPCLQLAICRFHNIV